MYFAQAIACQITRVPNLILGSIMVIIGVVGMWATLLVYSKIKHNLLHPPKEIQKLSVGKKLKLFFTILLHPDVMRMSIAIPTLSFLTLGTLLIGIGVVIASIFAPC